MDAYKYKGRVHYVGRTQTWPSGFAKRTLVLKAEGDGQYPNYAAFEFTKGKGDNARDRTRDLDGLRNGEMVEVSFFTDANESKVNPGQWFVSNKGFKVERAAGTGAVTIPMHAATPPVDNGEPDASAVDDMPF